MGDQASGGNLAVVFSRMTPYILMVCMQFGMAGNYILSMISLNSGMNRYVLIVYRNGVAALVLAPFALLLERKIRPKITFPVFLRIMALGLLEPILDQGFSYLGMQYTSASFGSAIMNAVPSVTFVIALIFHVRTIYKGPEIGLPWSHQTSHHASTAASSDKHWVAGTLLLLVGCVSWSSFYVLQTETLKKYPAELSLASLICLAGSMQSLVIALAVAHHPRSWAVGWDSRLFTPLYTGIVSSGITYYVQGLVMKTRGPVFVTAFNPLCMIIVTALGSAILAEKLHLGSVLGGIIIAIGLYSVVWGKRKDYASPEELSITAGKGNQELPIATTNIATT
ncbi:WAT1-RELATED PROTEIN [Salix purpurea]|uniref:WAT1-related protein n=1 Tax=Salix purpurea TaxID=77065 RepID=A0A9Q0WVG1_SALPP|nr:WAT1-RELATED PROTEIN [Salix purpurea]